MESETEQTLLRARQNSLVLTPKLDSGSHCAINKVHETAKVTGRKSPVLLLSLEAWSQGVSFNAVLDKAPVASVNSCALFLNV